MFILHVVEQLCNCNSSFSVDFDDLVVTVCVTVFLPVCLELVTLTSCSCIGLGGLSNLFRGVTSVGLYLYLFYFQFF